MTPTLAGRWQTRILLFIFIGLPVTYLYAGYLGLDQAGRFADPFWFLGTITALGLVLDPLYIQIQRFRWENDWPFAFQLFFSILEFLAVLGMMNLGLLDGLLIGRIPSDIAITHFTFVLAPSFLAILGGIQIFMLRWRFKGGEIGRH